MKRGLKYGRPSGNDGQFSRCEGTFPDEEGTEIKKSALVSDGVRVVKEPSPMKRGLKSGAKAALSARFPV